MRALLDTCTLIWATLSPSTLSSKARQIIADQGNEVIVSTASAWEIPTKVRIGRLQGVEKLELDFVRVIEGLATICCPSTPKPRFEPAASSQIIAILSTA
jgi:PIN domain nuclease of toxin-antitoxin system